MEKYFHEEKFPWKTKNNLNRLQKISDDVKFLTKQLQRSIELKENNRNNNSASTSLGSFHSLPRLLDQRLLGEICYQLERRILTLIFSPSKQFYGYSLRYLPSIIEHEQNAQQRLVYKKRFEQIQIYLRRGQFRFDYHSIVTFRLINEYGIYFDYQWLFEHHLENIRQIQSLCQTMFAENFNEDLQIILHSLELISNFDGKPIFYW